MTNIYRAIQQESAKLCGYINQLVLSKMNPITMGLFTFLPVHNFTSNPTHCKF